MAKTPSSADVSQISRVELLDESGRTIRVSEYRVEVVEDASGQVSVQRTSQQMLTESGQFYHTGMRPEDMSLAACDVCRHPGRFLGIFPRATRSGLCDARHLKLCAGCGKPLCPRHAKTLSRWDKRVWCPTCLTRARHRLRVRNIFCERVDQ